MASLYEHGALDGQSDVASTSQLSDSPTSPTRTNWSLWPLKTSSTTLHNKSNSKSTLQGSLDSAQTSSRTYASSFSSSPPSPFGPGQHSESSPPCTPPDAAPNGIYTERYSIDAGVAATATSIPSLSNTKVALSREAINSVQVSPSLSMLSPSSSRNDIFSSPVASPVPAPRLSVTSLNGGDQGPLSRSNSLKNPRDIIDSPSSLYSPSPKLMRPRVFSDLRQKTITERDIDRPNYGRSNDQERERERARIRQSNAEVEFRLCPVKDYLLGEGRHCTVYLGSYRTMAAKREFREDRRGIQTDWTLCAIKRLHADRQSQLLGLDEAFALRRLGPHPNLVGLISMRDEVELATAVPLQDHDDNSWSGSAMPVNVYGEERDEMQYSRIGKGLPPSSSLSSLAAGIHGRSTSQAQKDPTLSDRQHTHTHRRQISTPTTRTPIVMVASPEGDEMFASPITADVPTWEERNSFKENNTLGISTDPPRLLLLLELLPYNLSSFTRKNPERCDLIQWKQWACELAGVVEWLHSKGCVHADLKPENVLLTTDLKVKLCDFNSALFPNPNTPLTDGLGLGTPAYGAPELASSSKGFSYPVDVWSLGAILYSVAVGREPFQKARSMIDILHRKRVFFETEENDRIAALCVAEGRGASISGSTTASRKGSLRGRRKGESDYTNGTARPTSTLQRQASTDSVSSIASSVMLSGTSGRTPSVRAINMLLEPSPPIGVFVPAGAQTSPTEALTFGKRGSDPHVLVKSTVAKISTPVPATTPSSPGGSTNGHGHHRATSLGKAQANSLLSPTAARKATIATRPATILRRTNSFNGGVDDLDIIDDAQKQQDDSTQQASPTSVHDDSIEPKRDSAGLRLAVTAAFAQSRRVMQQAKIQDQFFLESQYEDEMTEAELSRPYQDGSPALILPGGGRLPDEARNLLERMLSADADRRPTAAQLRKQLEML